MKKLILMALALVLASSVCYAQPAAAPKVKVAAPMAVKAVETKDEKSMEKVFLVKSTTTIYDTDFKAVGLDIIKADDKVKVKYTTTKEGVYEAISINLVK